MKYLALLSFCSLLVANDDMLNLMEELTKASEISTKTKLNINKTPAVVSVLHASELQKLGFTSLYEALEATPGVEISMGIGGGKQINMRGNKSLVTDKLKFMIDGVSINAELSGANHFYLNMPLENIERIEIIRGPASALYGSFAHIGVINVITKASTHKKGGYFVRASTEGSRNIGVTQHINSEDIKIALMGSFEENLKTRQYENYSLLRGEYNSYEDFKERSFGTDIELFKDFSLTSKYLQLNIENYYGYGTWPIVQDPKELEHSSWINELRYTPKITQDLSLDLKVGYKEYGMQGDSRVTPFSLLIPTSKDLIAGGEYKERSIYTDIAAHYSIDAHIFRIGSYLQHTSVKNPYYAQNALLPIVAPIASELKSQEIEGGGIKESITRKHYAFYLSDMITLSPQWMANIGLRYDHYSDADSAFSPKLSLLYMADEHQSYKLMYQNSFRVLTFVELYGTQAPFIGDEELESETIDTLEFAYSYQRGYENYFNINFFYSQKKNFIYRDTAFMLKNGLDATAYGAEIEYKTPLFEGATLETNYSYIYSEDENGVETPLIANHLANAMFSYQIIKNWHTGSRLRYVGDKKREVNDTRDTLNGYTTFDQTLTYTNEKLTLRVSIKNLFDADVRYIAPVGNEITAGTYMDDLERDGRTFWLSAEWKFE